jgi:hypothetical protein
VILTCVGVPSIAASRPRLALADEASAPLKRSAEAGRDSSRKARTID